MTTLRHHNQKTLPFPTFINCLPTKNDNKFIWKTHEIVIVLINKKSTPQRFINFIKLSLSLALSLSILNHKFLAFLTTFCCSLWRFTSTCIFRIPFIILASTYTQPALCCLFMLFLWFTGTDIWFLQTAHCNGNSTMNLQRCCRYPVGRPKFHFVVFIVHFQLKTSDMTLIPKWLINMPIYFILYMPSLCVSLSSCVYVYCQ